MSSINFSPYMHPATDAEHLELVAAMDFGGMEIPQLPSLHPQFANMTINQTGGQSSFSCPPAQPELSNPPAAPSAQAGFSNPPAAPSAQAGFSNPSAAPSAQAGFSNPPAAPSAETGFSNPSAAPSAETGFSNPSATQPPLVVSFTPQLPRHVNFQLNFENDLVPEELSNVPQLEDVIQSVWRLREELSNRMERVEKESAQASKAAGTQQMDLYAMQLWLSKARGQDGEAGAADTGAADKPMKGDERPATQ